MQESEPGLDALTQLPNRRLLLDRLQRLVLSSQRTHPARRPAVHRPGQLQDLNDTLEATTWRPGSSPRWPAALVWRARMRLWRALAAMVRHPGSGPALTPTRRPPDRGPQTVLALNAPFELADRQHYSTPASA